MAILKFLLVVFGAVEVARAFILLDQVECQPHWTRYGGHCYRFFGTAKTWAAAEQHCSEFFTRFGQGHLASVHHPDENNFLIELWKTSFPSSASWTFLWLGATDQETEGHFVWTDGTAFNYKPWISPSEPNNGDGGEDCLCIMTHNENIGLNDSICSRAYPYICKLPTAGSSP